MPEISGKMMFMLVSLFAVQGVYAQLSVDGTAPFNSPTYLVQNVLLGTGVVASNISYVGDPKQIGYFDGQNSNIGLDSGIVMSSDDIIDNIPSGFGSGITGIGNDNDLLNIANSVPPMIGQNFSVSAIYDKCILEFDFVPSDDTVEFKYVFGSDEYLTYVNSSYNDVFAFLISGPGITGPYQSPTGFPGGAKNIAVVPNSSPSLPITISSVNNVLNSQYYIDNPSNTTVGLNGFTNVFTAMSPVMPCQTYHIKLAIADGSDGALVSSVFLEAKSFSSGTVTISATPPNVLSGTTGGADTALYESCGPVLVTLIRNGDLSMVDTVLLTTSGNAVEGTDYSNIPDTLIFLPGDTIATFSFDPLQDGVPEGLDTLNISIDQSNICFSGNAGFLSLSISDLPPVVLVTTPDDTVNCLSSPFPINVQATGIPPLQYQWSTGVNDTDTVITVNPVITTEYYVTVSDGCGINSSVDTVTISVISDTLSIFTEDDTVSCISSSSLITVQVLSGVQPVSYLWSTTEVTQSITVSPPVTTNYLVTVTDACGLYSEVGVVTVVVLGADVQVFAIGGSAVCPGDTVVLEANPTGGYPPYTVWWDTNGVIIPDTLLVSNPQGTVTYTAYATDQCGLDTGTVDVTISVATYQPLVADAGEDDTLHCPGDVIIVKPSATGGSGGYTYTWTNWADTRDSLVANPLVTTTYLLGVTDNCPTDTVYDTINVVIPVYLPLLVTTSDTLINSCPHDRVDLVASAVGGDGNYSYSWSNFAGAGDSVSVFPPSSGTYSIYVSDNCGNRDTATIIVSIEVPEADFTFEFRADNNIFFYDASLSADTFFWDFGDGGTSTEKNPVYSYSQEGEYDVMLLVTSEYGCTDSIVRKVLPPLEIWVPNAFSPNGDEINDVFQVMGIGLRKYSIMIFDRWGDLIYQSDNMSNAWDGKSLRGVLLKTGVYTYHIRATGISYEKFEKFGTITLFR